MSKTVVAAVILIIGAVVIFLNASQEVSVYGTFDKAIYTGERMKVVGQLVKTKPMNYDPIKNPNQFSFYLKDNNGQIEKVLLLKSKPQDFELSEQIVLTGQMGEEGFVATDILMKCPSKYKEEELKLREESTY